ncbi:hypothetical protein ACI2LF_35020 [Kribbella sp. NPDC020789]
MAASDEIFLALGGSLESAAGRIAGVLELEFVGDLGGTPGESQYKAPARTFAGIVGVYVGIDRFPPEPGGTLAIDGYPVVVDVQSRQRKDAQAAEARLIFEALVAGLPEIPILLTNNVEFLVAAYLPGVGVHEFPADTTLDEDDAERWGPWVRKG